MSKYIKTLKYNDGNTTYAVDTRAIKDADNTSQTLKQKLDAKANTTGTYSGLNVGYATSAGSAATAVKATAADDADTLDGKEASDFLASTTKYALSDSVGGVASKATADADGNIISSTYATKVALNSCLKVVLEDE